MAVAGFGIVAVGYWAREKDFSMVRLFVYGWVLCVCSFVLPSAADIINVPGDYGTIQEGIDAAQDGDEVVVGDGVWTGPGNVNLDIGGKPITVRSENGPDGCIIDCEGVSEQRGFVLTSGETSATVVEGFTIRNGNMVSSGGIYIRDSSPTIKNCIITDCQSALGAAIYMYDSNSLIIDCTFNSNTSATSGGGLYISLGSPRIVRGSFSNNVTPGLGSGIACFGSDAVVKDCVFTGNSADIGGGMYSQGGNPTVTGCSFVGNNATRFGGGMTNDGSSPTVDDCDFTENTSGQGGGGCASSSGSAPIFTNCSFTDNTSLNGGGLFNLNVDTPLVGCTFNGNHARRFGGAIYNSQSDPQIVAITAVGNTAVNGGGGIYNTFSNPLVGGAIIRDNSPNQIFDGSSSTSTVYHSNIQGGWGGLGNIDEIPLFVNPNKGDLRLLPGSPGIDAGNNLLVPPGTLVDIYGDVRFVDDPETKDTGLPGGDGGSNIIDMGAAEFQPDDCLADFNGDGIVNSLDFLAFLNAFVNGEAIADFNGDGVINTLDFLAFLNAFIEGCG